MAIVIHEIKGHFYAYEHTREGNKVVTRYLYPTNAEGIKHAPYKEVKQQEDTEKEEYTPFKQQEFKITPEGQKYQSFAKDQHTIIDAKEINYGRGDVRVYVLDTYFLADGTRGYAIREYNKKNKLNNKYEAAITETPLQNYGSNKRTSEKDARKTFKEVTDTTPAKPETRAKFEKSIMQALSSQSSYERKADKENLLKAKYGNKWTEYTKE